MCTYKVTAKLFSLRKIHKVTKREKECLRNPMGTPPTRRALSIIDRAFGLGPCARVSVKEPHNAKIE